MPSQQLYDLRTSVFRSISGAHSWFPVCAVRPLPLRPPVPLPDALIFVCVGRVYFEREAEPLISVVGRRRDRLESTSLVDQQGGPRVRRWVCGMHPLRGALAVAMIGNGVTIPVVSAVLGHASSDTVNLNVDLDIMLCVLAQALVDRPACATTRLHHRHPRRAATPLPRNPRPRREPVAWKSALGRCCALAPRAGETHAHFRCVLSSNVAEGQAPLRTEWRISSTSSSATPRAA